MICVLFKNICLLHDWQTFGFFKLKTTPQSQQREREIDSRKERQGEMAPLPSNLMGRDGEGGAAEATEVCRKTDEKRKRSSTGPAGLG